MLIIVANLKRLKFIHLINIMDFYGILFALDDTDFEDSGSEYNPSDVVYESDSDNRIGVEPDTENTQNLVQQENNIISDEWLNVTGKVVLN